MLDGIAICILGFAAFRDAMTADLVGRDEARAAD
jgi:hypothetical protein